MSDSDDRLIITADDAIELLPDGDTIHNYANPSGGLLLGCDLSRDDAILHLKAAIQIEIGGDICRSMRHPIGLWTSDKRVTFFEADMDKLASFEDARARS